MQSLRLAILLSLSSMIQAMAPKLPEPPLSLNPLLPVDPPPAAPPPPANSLPPINPLPLPAPVPPVNPLPPNPQSEVVDCNSYPIGGAPETCQNICWYLNCYKGKNEFTCDPASADRHRKESGCDRHPCTGAFAQKDPFKGFIAHGGIGDGVYAHRPSCDEFPPASFTQGGRDARLRCIDSSDNSRSGNWYKAMCKRHPTTSFSIAVKNQGALSQCQPNPNCKNDPASQFFLRAPYSTQDYTPGKRDMRLAFHADTIEDSSNYGAPENDADGTMGTDATPNNVTRREYRMSDGSTMLLLSRDEQHDFEVGSSHLEQDGSVITVVQKL